MHRQSGWENPQTGHRGQADFTSRAGISNVLFRMSNRIMAPRLRLGAISSVLDPRRGTFSMSEALKVKPINVLDWEAFFASEHISKRANCACKGSLPNLYMKDFLVNCTDTRRVNSSLATLIQTLSCSYLLSQC